jgi:hypothetical protein
MSGIQFAPRVVGANAAPEPTPTTPAETAPPELTDEQKQFATDHPAGTIPVSRDGARMGWRIGGGATALLGGAIAGIGMLRGGGPVPLVIGGALAAAGLGTALIVPSTIKDTQRVVVASKFDSRREAQLLANSMVGRRIEVIESSDGTFGIADMGPVATSGPRPNYPTNYYPYDPYYGDHWGHHHHDHYYHEYPQYYPGFPDYGWNPYPSYPDYSYPDPGYPSGGYGGSTSPGDDY